MTAETHDERERVTAFVDGELDAAAEAEFTTVVASSPGLETQVAAERFMKAWVGKRARRPAAPAALREAVVARLREPLWRVISRRLGGMGTLAVAALVVLVLWRVLGPSAQPAFSDHAALARELARLSGPEAVPDGTAPDRQALARFMRVGTLPDALEVAWKNLDNWCELAILNRRVARLSYQLDGSEVVGFAFTKRCGLLSESVGPCHVCRCFPHEGTLVCAEIGELFIVAFTELGAERIVELFALNEGET